MRDLDSAQACPARHRGEAAVLHVLVRDMLCHYYHIAILLVGAGNRDGRGDHENAESKTNEGIDVATEEKAPLLGRAGGSRDRAIFCFDIS